MAENDNWNPEKQGKSQRQVWQNINIRRAREKMRWWWRPQGFDRSGGNAESTGLLLLKSVLIKLPLWLRPTIPGSLEKLGRRRGSGWSQGLDTNQFLAQIFRQASFSRTVAANMPQRLTLWNFLRKHFKVENIHKKLLWLKYLPFYSILLGVTAQRDDRDL